MGYNPSRERELLADWRSGCTRLRDLEIVRKHFRIPLLSTPLILTFMHSQRIRDETKHICAVNETLIFFITTLTFPRGSRFSRIGECSGSNVSGPPRAKDTRNARSLSSTRSHKQPPEIVALRSGLSFSLHFPSRSPCLCLIPG